MNWAKRKVQLSEAEDALAHAPLSETGHGVAVPMPFVDRSFYQKDFDTRTINHAIEKAPIKKVPIGELSAIQHSVKAPRVLQYLRDPDRTGAQLGDKHPKANTPIDHPVVIKYKGKKLLHDGHHRTTAHALMGDKDIEARVVDLDSLKKSA